jgi:hypothetical protein
MELVTLREAQIIEVARHSWAADLDSPAAVAEALRTELWARQVSTRRALCQRVVELMRPVHQIDLDSVTRILAELERSGDVTGGDHGRLAAAPLRAVDLGGGQYRLFGGPATRRLHQLLGQREVAGAFSRQVTVSEDSEAVFRQRLTATGGVILTPEQWSGLDRTPPADDAWLAGLDDELRYNPGAPLALPEGYDDWRCYVPDSGEAEQQLRWKKPPPDNTGRLWRARHERGFRMHVWTTGNSPLQGGHLRLNQDQASRTAFALDRVAGCPLAMEGKDNEAFVEMSVSAFVPIAEYRFLLTLGERLEATGIPRYRVPKNVWPQVVSMLEIRLGIVVQVERETT